MQTPLQVCNHPDLFEPRPIISPFRMLAVEFYTASLILQGMETTPFQVQCLCTHSLVQVVVVTLRGSLNAWLDAWSSAPHLGLLQLSCTLLPSSPLAYSTDSTIFVVTSYLPIKTF